MRKGLFRKVTAFALSLSLFGGCTKKLPSLETEESGTGGEKSIYDMVYFGEIETLNYLVTDTEVDYALCSNLVDNLMDYDSYGNIVPGLAESWSSNDDMTVWTFKIRKGVKWVDCDGNEVAEVKADDWVASAQYVNDAFNESGNQYIYDTGGVVRNAQNYYDYTEYMMLSDSGKRTVDEDGNEIVPVDEVKPGDIGVTAPDDYTLVYTLDYPCPFFLSCLSYSAYMPVNRQFLNETGDMFGRSKENILYNGAFRLTEFIPQERRTFVKNDKYWDKDNVHIDEIRAKFQKDPLQVTPEMFLNGDIDQVLISADAMESWMSDPEAASQVHSMRPDIAYSYFYGFNFDPQFDARYEPDNWRKAVVNEDFRKSVMYSLDRRALAEVYEPYNPEILLQKTITPKTFVSVDGKDYTDLEPFKNIQARDPLNTELAKSHRDKARAALEAQGARGFSRSDETRGLYGICQKFQFGQLELALRNTVPGGMPGFFLQHLIPEAFQRVKIRIQGFPVRGNIVFQQFFLDLRKGEAVFFISLTEKDFQKIQKLQPLVCHVRLLFWKN